MMDIKGVIVYDPFRNRMRSANWCIVEVDPEITRYYRWWLEKERCLHLAPPSWDAHVSVVRGEKIPHGLRDAWKRHASERVIMTLESPGNFKEFKDNTKGGMFYTCDVTCDALCDIREELGLRRFNTFHLTVGRTHEYEARKPKRSASY